MASAPVGRPKELTAIPELLGAGELPPPLLLLELTPCPSKSTGPSPSRRRPDPPRGPKRPADDRWPDGPPGSGTTRGSDRLRDSVSLGVSGAL